MITLEDVNSVFSKYGFNVEIHEIDTSKIGTKEYSDVKYDFCICGHSINGGTHTFTFQIVNRLWTGLFYFLDSKGKYINNPNMTIDNVNKTLRLVTSEEKVFLKLHCAMVSSFNISQASYVVDDNPITINYSQIGTNLSVERTNLITGDVDNVDVKLQKGKLEGMVKTCFVRKIDYELLLDANLTMGKVNTVSFTIPDGFDADCLCSYLDKTSRFKLSDGEFSIDLTDYEGNQTLNLNVQIFENNKVLSKTTDYKLPVSYVRVSNYADLVNQILSGASIVELTDDITCYDNIYVNHDLLLVGNGFELDLDTFSFSIASDNTFKMNNVNVVNGNPVILQRKNSQVDLTGCSFTGATNSQYNNLGSVISCDLDIASLDVVDDFITNIADCSFINNHNVILHGGTLNIINCRYHNTDIALVDVNNPAFLYQADGLATITDSIFDIDYIGNTFESNINYGQALFTCGINALINNASHDELSKDNNVNWCNAPYNNLSHIYAKYYYPSINEIVVSSPVEDMEDKALCYAVSGLGQVFKSNVQITRDSMKNDNINRKITWEE